MSLTYLCPLNYLAHLLLADPDPEHRLGNLLGDFMHGVDLEDLPVRVQEGVLRHRAVDRFTDAHPVVVQSRQRLDTRFRHLRGVLVDVFHDHFLSRHWSRFSPQQSLADFVAEVYQLLEAATELFSPRLRQVAPAWVQHDLLGSYGEVATIERVLGGMARRLRRQTPLAEGVEELVCHYDSLEADFLRFFPEVQEHAAMS